MKQSFLLAFTLGLSLVLPQAVVAGDLSYLQKPAVPTYETCAMLTVNNGNGSYQVQDSDCISRNAEKTRNYQAAVEAYNRSAAMISNTSSSSTSSMTLQKPVEPEYETCQVSDNGYGGYTDYACQSRNLAKKREYDMQMMGWNRYQQEQAQTTQNTMSELQQEAEKIKAASAAESLRKAQEANARSAAKSQSGAAKASAISSAFAAAFAASCSGGATCQYKLLAASMAFNLMSAQSSKQASQNYQSQYASCVAQSQLSSESLNCSNISTTADASNATLTNTFDSSGKCIAADPSTCQAVLNALPEGTSIKDIFGKKTDAYKTNADGTMTTKDGKTYKASDFKDKASMLAAGFTEEQANAVLAAMGKAGVDKSKLTADLKDKSKKIDFGGAAISGSGTESTAAGLTGSPGELGSAAIKDSEGKRAPAAAGLTRDFNGETIGAAGDDIFIMMNRRYKMKTAQDTFFSN